MVKNIFLGILIFIITITFHFLLTRIGASLVGSFLDIRLSVITSVLFLLIGIYFLIKRKKSIGIGIISATLVHIGAWIWFFWTY
jgi:hypothetical protein